MADYTNYLDWNNPITEDRITKWEEPFCYECDDTGEIIEEDYVNHKTTKRPCPHCKIKPVNPKEYSPKMIKKMKREIKFRGISALTGKMIYGQLLKISNANFIFSTELPDFIYETPRPDEFFEVTEKFIISKRTKFVNSICENVVDESIGQFTGLLDKNGKEIYEGDITSYQNPYSDKTYINICKWDNLFACFGLFSNDSEFCKESDWVKIQDIEIVGNIHETN